MADLVNLMGKKIELQHDKILVTGASGFIGSALLQRLIADGWDAIGAVRQHSKLDASCRIGPSLDETADWRPLLAGRDVVVHTAARVHVMNEDSASARRAHFRVNTEGTLKLVRQAAESGVRRFVFISTVKVMGELSIHPFRTTDSPAPCDPYAESKLAAEVGLRQVAEAAKMEWVVIRPPLVYGPGVGGNLATLIRWIERGIPLPLSAVHNRRSLVGRDNLIDFVTLCLDHPSAANALLFVSDGHDVSTSELIRLLSVALKVRPMLIPVPIGLLTAIGRLIGCQHSVQRLCANLQVDISDARQHLGWHPPISVEEGLRQAVRGAAR